MAVTCVGEQDPGQRSAYQRFAQRYAALLRRVCRGSKHRRPRAELAATTQRPRRFVARASALLCQPVQGFLC
jgi:hypothetical protein